MSFFDWLRSKWSTEGKAAVLYRRGMLKAKLHNHRGALADYTAVIDMAGVSDDLRAMAFYNRAVVYVAQHDDSAASRDLQELLGMPGAAANVKTAARQQLVRMQRTIDRAADRAVPPEG